MSRIELGLGGVRVGQLAVVVGDEVRRSSDRGTAATKAAEYYELIRERKRAEVVLQVHELTQRERIGLQVWLDTSVEAALRNVRPNPGTMFVDVEYSIGPWGAMALKIPLYAGADVPLRGHLKI